LEGKNIKNLFEEAGNALNELEDREYAPIHNSSVMLGRIREYYENDVRTLDEEIISEINVGLLAAKALDFEPKFKNYSGLLHSIWNLFLLFLSVYYAKYPYIIPLAGPLRDA
jgi:hypothetical protein